MAFHISMVPPESEIVTLSSGLSQRATMSEAVLADDRPQRLKAKMSFAPSGKTVESGWTWTAQYVPLEVEMQSTLDRSCIAERGFMPIMVPKAYAVIGTLSVGFLVAGLLLSSVMVALSGLGLMATIGTATWEIRKRAG
jgi:hypothetical protein